MVTIISHNEQETQGLGERWAAEAGAGWVIGLQGDLGAGKTQLVKGLAQGLSIPERILSPTFTLVHEYRGPRLRLFHLDLYRLETPEQIIAAGMNEYFYRPDGLTVVEWIERWSPTLAERVPPGGHYRQARLEIVDEQRRRICYEDFSP